MVQALQEFIKSYSDTLLSEEAKRQSLLARHYETDEDVKSGGENCDTTGWEPELVARS